MAGLGLKHATNNSSVSFRTRNQALQLMQSRNETNYEIIRFQKAVTDILWSIKERGNQAVSEVLRIGADVEVCLTKLIHIQHFDASCSTVVIVSTYLSILTGATESGLAFQ